MDAASPPTLRPYGGLSRFTCRFIMPLSDSLRGSCFAYTAHLLELNSRFFSTLLIPFLTCLASNAIHLSFPILKLVLRDSERNIFSQLHSWLPSHASTMSALAPFTPVYSHPVTLSSLYALAPSVLTDGEPKSEILDAYGRTS